MIFRCWVWRQIWLGFSYLVVSWSAESGVRSKSLFHLRWTPTYIGRYGGFEPLDYMVYNTNHLHASMQEGAVIVGIQHILRHSCMQSNAHGVAGIDLADIMMFGLQS